MELTKPAGKKAYVVKLVKGATPHEWLVSEVTERRRGEVQSSVGQSNASRSR